MSHGEFLFKHIQVCFMKLNGVMGKYRRLLVYSFYLVCLLCGITLGYLNQLFLTYFATSSLFVLRLACVLQSQCLPTVTQAMIPNSNKRIKRYYFGNVIGITMGMGIVKFWKLLRLRLFYGIYVKTSLYIIRSCRFRHAVRFQLLLCQATLDC